MLVQSLGWVDPLEESMATHSSILAWRIPWTEELAGYSPQGHKESVTTGQLTLSHTYVQFSKSYNCVCVDYHVNQASVKLLKINMCRQSETDKDIERGCRKEL